MFFYFDICSNKLLIYYSFFTSVFSFIKTNHHVFCDKINPLMEVIMNPKFKIFLLQHSDIDNISMNDTTIFNEISTNQTVQQIIQLYIETVQKLGFKRKYKYILIEYMKWFECISKQYKYDEINKNPNIIFPSISIYSDDFHSYAYFDVDYCTTALLNTKIYTFTDINPNEIFYSKRPISKPRPIDWNNPIILIQTIDYPEFQVIDGNHRYQNAILQNLSLPMQILQYDAVTPECFINPFNYLLFEMKNEFNRIYSLCASNIDIKTIKKQIEDYKELILALLETH